MNNLILTRTTDSYESPFEKKVVILPAAFHIVIDTDSEDSVISIIFSDQLGKTLHREFLNLDEDYYRHCVEMFYEESDDDRSSFLSAFVDGILYDLSHFLHSGQYTKYDDSDDKCDTHLIHTSFDLDYYIKKWETELFDLIIDYKMTQNSVKNKNEIETHIEGK